MASPAAPAPCGAPGPSRRAWSSRPAAAQLRPRPPRPDRATRHKPPPCQRTASCLHTRETLRDDGVGSARSVDVGPAPVALEHDLAPIAAENDLEMAPPDRRRVAPAHGAGCCFHLKRSRQGFDLDL